MNTTPVSTRVSVGILQSIEKYREDIQRIKSSIRLSIGSLALIFSDIDDFPDFLSMEQVETIEGDVRRVINHLHQNIDDIDVTDFELDRVLYRERLRAAIIKGRTRHIGEEK